MSDQITFTLDAESVSINAPGASGTTVDVGANWATDLSEGLQRWSHRLTDSHVEQWSISVDDLTATQWINFQDFFYKVAEGPTNTFTYTHSDGVSYTARFLDNGLKAKRESSALWSTSFRLELASQKVNG